MLIMAIIAIMCIIQIITIFKIIICFHGWNEGTIEGLGSSVGHSRSREQEQHTSIPDCLWRYDESSIINAIFGTFSTETDCSKPAALPCTWCAPAPNNCTVQNGPCVWPILAAPMSQGGQLPDKICVIICIWRMISIIATRIKIYSGILKLNGYYLH